MEENEPNIYQQFIRREPLFHVLLWCMVLFYPYVKYIGKEGGYPMSFLHELNSLFFKMTISYLCYFWFYPKTNKGKHLPLLIIGFICNIILYEYIDHLFHPGDTHFWLHFTANSLTYISFALVFFTIYTVKTTYKKQVEIDKLIKEKQQSELNLLKARVNPHFLFNTLNTIYANALKKDDKTPELILKLSDSFRYLMHEGQKTKVTLEQELQHMRDYVDLQKERLSTKVIVDYSENIDDYNIQISPLLLIGFVENAFKYTSILKGGNHLITIRVQLVNALFSFHCKNPVEQESEKAIEIEWKESGIGNENSAERLRLIYPKRHSLIIEDTKKTYTVNLEISL